MSTEVNQIQAAKVAYDAKASLQETLGKPIPAWEQLNGSQRDAIARDVRDHLNGYDRGVGPLDVARHLPAAQRLGEHVFAAVVRAFRIHADTEAMEALRAKQFAQYNEEQLKAAHQAKDEADAAQGDESKALPPWEDKEPAPVTNEPVSVPAGTDGKP